MLNLDFTNLHAIKTQKNEPQEKNTKNIYNHTNKSAKTDVAQNNQLEPTTVNGIKTIQKEIEYQKDRIKEEQDRIYNTSMLKSSIVKGIRKGESIEILFLKAVKCIAFATKEPAFYTFIKNDIKTIYSDVFKRQGVIDCEIKELEKRLNLLESAYKKETERASKTRIEQAIEEHQKEIKKLKGENIGKEKRN